MIDLVKIYKEVTGDDLIEGMKEKRSYISKDGHLGDFLAGFEFGNDTKELVLKAEKLLDTWVGEECYIDNDDDIFISVLAKATTTNNSDYYFTVKLSIDADFETECTGDDATLYEAEDYNYTLEDYKINGISIESIQLLENFIP